MVATESQPDPAREGDPALAAPVAAGEGDLAEPGDVSGVSGLADSLNLPETDAVPF